MITNPSDSSNVEPIGSRSKAAFDSVAVICSCHFNAVGIALSLREIGWHGPIVCLKINTKEGVTAERFPHLCKCLPLNIRTPQELPETIVKWTPADQIGAVFFCDERFLAAFNETTKLIFPNACIHTGSVDHLESILDRKLFYRRLEESNCSDIPVTFDSSQDPWKLAGDAFRTRVWRSWRGLEKLPRGRTIRSSRELREWQILCKEKNLGPEEWGYQELLSTAPKDVVSVCGWHGLEGAIYRTTRWIKQSGENAWLVEANDGDHELWRTTRNVLDLFEYTGPFELEFVRHPTTGKFHIIELNPRFWLQHRLLGNILVQRYLGISNGHRTQAMPRYWVNTDAALSLRTILRHPDVLPYLLHAVWAIPVRGSIRPSVRWLMR